MIGMKPGQILKIVALFAAVGVLPFLSGIFIGRAAEVLQAKSQTNRLAITTEVPTNTPSELIPESPAEPTPQPDAKPQPKVASAVTTPNNRPPLPQRTPAKPLATPAPLPSCTGNLTQKFLCLLNEYRVKKGLGKVTLNNNLSQVALGHSTWMNETGTFSHTGVDGSRLTERCAAAGIRCLAENLAEGIYSADELLSSWSANPSHNKNLLGPYTTIGFGVSGEYVTLLLN